MNTKPLATILMAAALAVTLLPTPSLHADPAIELRIGGGRPGPAMSDPRELSKALDNLDKAKEHLLRSGPPSGRKEAALRTIDDAMAQIRGILRHP